MNQGKYIFSQLRLSSESKVTGSQRSGYIPKYCCPVKINRKFCISLSIGVAAVLLIQGLGFQFQTVSIIKCTSFDKKRPIITDNSKK